MPVLLVEAFVGIRLGPLGHAHGRRGGLFEGVVHAPGTRQRQAKGSQEIHPRWTYLSRTFLPQGLAQVFNTRIFISTSKKGCNSPGARALPSWGRVAEPGASISTTHDETVNWELSRAFWLSGGIRVGDNRMEGAGEVGGARGK